MRGNRLQGTGDRGQGRVVRSSFILHPSSLTRRGMTLLELLIVVAILAVLTSVAVTSTDVLLGQGRCDATRRNLTSVEEAVLGPADARQADGTLSVTGFVADVGRLPVCANAVYARFGLAELWARPSTLAWFGIRSPTDDPEVKVPCGWRGPYVRLPLGHDYLLDGWGNSFVLLNTSGTAAELNQTIREVWSLGADQLAGGTQYDSDVGVVFDESRWQMTLQGNVYLVDSSGQRTNPTGGVLVMLYGPNPDTGGLLETQVTTTTTSGVVSYSVTTSIGPRFLRAYLGASVSAATAKSRILRVERSDVKDLEIPQ
jgi:prepilin-type N-terminal cleavage/methylation domain-containing protein